MNLKIKYLSDYPDLMDEFSYFLQDNWDPIGTLDDIGCKHWFDFIEQNKDLQFAFYLEDKLVAVGNCAPIYDDLSPEDLPDKGWQWAILQSLKKESEINYLSAISATVSKSYRGRGISKKILNEFKSLAKKKNTKGLIAPIRPVLKSSFPLISMEEYCLWRDKNDLSFDPWIKVHQSLGGKIIRISKEAMTVTGDLSKWRDVLGHEIYSSGSYLVPGGLNPVEINLEKNTGIYKEDGVWIFHSLS